MMGAPVPLDGPGVAVSDPRELLLGYLDWYRDAALRKVAGLPDEQLRRPVPPLDWSPLGLVKHLGWVERRWIRWGFAAEDIEPYLPGEELVEYTVDPGESTESVLAFYGEQVAWTRAAVAGVPLDAAAKLGGRFATPDQTPSLGRILFHLLQEYARHVGHLDIARELIDGTRGE
jgi:hypothetical protein